MDVQQGPAHPVELADAAEALDQIGWEFRATVEIVTLSAHSELLSDVLRQTLLGAAPRVDSQSAIREPMITVRSMGSPK